MALTASITARKPLQKGQKLSNATVNAVGHPTISITGTVDTAEIENDAVTPAKMEYGAFFWASASGTNTITLTTGNSLSGTPETGEVVTFKSAAANTDTVDVTVDSYATGNLYKHGNVELAAGDIRNGQVCVIRYDGSAWQLVSALGSTEIKTGEDAGSTDAYAILASPGISAYYTGMVAVFKANTANTGAATLNVNSQGATAIKKLKDQDLETGDILAGQWVTVVYDGTNFQMLSPSSQSTNPGVAGTNHNLTVVLGSDAAQEIDIDADQLTLTTAGGVAKLVTSVNLTVDMANTVAQNGLDDGTEANSTWYYVYVCHDEGSSTTFGLFSTSASAPSTDNVTFTHYAKVGVVFNDSSGDLAQFASFRQGRWYMETDGQAMSTSTETFTWAHPFGRKPSALRAVAVMGASTELNYAEGDEVDSRDVHETTGYYSALAPVVDSSNLKLVKHVGSVLIRDKTSYGNPAAATEANWSVKLYAEF